jgi:hypothetical protein
MVCESKNLTRHLGTHVTLITFVGKLNRITYMYI